MNNVCLVGKISKDLDIRSSANGTKFVRFTIACRRKMKNTEGKYDSDFISCIAFSKTADFIAQYFGKGSGIGITGSIQTGSYTAQDGTKRYTTDVIVDNAEFVSDSKNASQGVPVTQKQTEMQELPDEMELPF